MARTAVVAGTATATVGATKKMMGGGSNQQATAAQAAQEQQLAELQAQQAALAAQQAAASDAAGADTGSDFEQQLVQIQQLSALKDQGILSEEEFQAKKAQILGI